MSKTIYSAEPDPDGYWQVSSEDGKQVIVSGLSENEANDIARRMNSGEDL